MDIDKGEESKKLPHIAEFH